MKRIILLSFFALVATFVSAQQENEAIVTTPVINIIYRGIENQIVIFAPKKDLNGATLEAEGVAFKPGKKTGEFIATITGKKSLVKIIIADKQGKQIGITTYYIRNMPPPNAMILGKEGGLISKADVLKFKFFKGVMHNFNYDVRLKVASYKMTIYLGGDLIEMAGKGNKLTSRMIEKLQILRGGARIIFSDIKIKGPGGFVQEAPPLIFKVVK
jgi:hypothetical protein